MTKKLYILLSLIAFIAFGCKKKDEVKPLPTVDFSYSPVNPIAPGTVTFTNQSQNATTYLWNFGNGQTSTLANPSVNYTTGGIFSVTLSATGDGGTSTATKNITVTGTPTADFTFNPQNARAPTAITFTSTSQNAVSYSWDFGNGQTSTVQNPSINYSSGGTFTVTLTITGQGGLTNKTTKSVTILPTYTIVGITSLTILNYPATKTDGSNWDPAINGTFPDVYFNITVSGTTNSLYLLPSSSRIEDLRIADLPKGWATTDGTAFYNHVNLNQIIDVDLYDYDSIGSNEYMGTATFDFRTYITPTNPYPTTVTVTKGTTSIKLGLVWK